jgi:hypothetical protein
LRFAKSIPAPLIFNPLKQQTGKISAGLLLMNGKFFAPLKLPISSKNRGLRG